MNRIFLLRGYRGSGKDMLAEFLEKEYKFGRTSFANPLKDETCRQYSLSRNMGDDQSLKEVALLQYPVLCLDKFSESVNKQQFREFRSIDNQRPFSYVITESGEMRGFDSSGKTIGQLYHCPRSLFILEGSIKRSVNPHYWVDLLVSKLQTGKDYVISDWRYRSEIIGLKDALQNSEKNFNLVTIEISRFEPSEVQSIDSSERDLDGYRFDFYIDNMKNKNTTKKEVFVQMEQILELITGGN